EVLGQPGLRAALMSWCQLSRKDQSACTKVLDNLSSAVAVSARRLADTWSQQLHVSDQSSPFCSIRTELLRALLLSTKSPDELEDTLICDEIQRGCRIGIAEPIKGTGLWPADNGPKHTGYGLSMSAASSWKNYRSCDPFTAEVKATLDAEVTKGHMKLCDRPPPGCVLTKLACVVKPSGAIRLIDDLRRSGVNER
ncbi:hypothetical protein FOZ62_018517, partial [Perkinsus olseni]